EDCIDVWRALIARMPLLLPLLKPHLTVTPLDEKGNKDTDDGRDDQEKSSDSEVHSSHDEKVHVNSKVPELDAVINLQKNLEQQSPTDLLKSTKPDNNVS